MKSFLDCVIYPLLIGCVVLGVAGSTAYLVIYTLASYPNIIYYGLIPLLLLVTAWAIGVYVMR